MATETSLTYGSASYLTAPAGTQDSFSPECFSDEQRLMVETAHAFITGEVLPRVEEIDAQEPGLMRALVEKAGALGLLSADVPEEYGGLGAGLTVGVILADYLSGEASFGVAWGAHNTIGTLPIIFYGTPEQKARWLPGMACTSTSSHRTSWRTRAPPRRPWGPTRGSSSGACSRRSTGSWPRAGPW